MWRVTLTANDESESLVAETFDALQFWILEIAALAITRDPESWSLKVEHAHA